MNKQELQAICLIVNKLGWNDMPATVAIPTIERMVINDIAVGADCCGVVDDFEDSLLSLSAKSCRDLWSTLFINDFQSLHDYATLYYAHLLRNDVEDLMRGGYSFEDACKEYDILPDWYYKEQENAVMKEVQEMSEFLGHYDIADTVTFYGKIWDKQYMDEEDAEYEQYCAWHDTMMSLRY